MSGDVRVVRHPDRVDVIVTPDLDAAMRAFQRITGAAATTVVAMSAFVDALFRCPSCHGPMPPRGRCRRCVARP